jgi:hypothetical protein
MRRSGANRFELVLLTDASSADTNCLQREFSVQKKLAKILLGYSTAVETRPGLSSHEVKPSPANA